MNEADIMLLNDWHRHKSLKCKRGIYAIRNLGNGKRYVGSASVCFRERWRRHLWLLRKGRHHSPHLQRAWNIAPHNLAFEVLEECSSEQCFDREQFYIDSLKACDDRHGYNMVPLAGRTTGYKHSEESLKRMSEAQKGKRHTDETRVRMSLWQKGKIIPAESREKMSAAQKRRMAKPEERERLRSCPKKKSYTDAERLTAYASRRGRKHSDEWKENISRGHQRRRARLNPSTLAQAVFSFAE
jgi:group I intron endonuclease